MDPALLISPASSSSSRPSFFEVFASQQLNASLRPAVRFALNVLAVRHRCLRRLADNSDEIFTAILLIVEATQLSRHYSLLSESFYSLRRSSTPLSKNQIILSLLLDVIVPYLRVRLDAVHSRLTGGAAAALFEHEEELEEEGRGGEEHGTVLSRARSSISAAYRRLSTMSRNELITKIYPKLRACVDLCNVILNLLYLYDYCPHFSLSLLIQRLVLRRITRVDRLKMALYERLRSIRSPPGPASSAVSRSVLANRALTVLRAAFVSGILAFRFLQYYYAAESELLTNVYSNTILPALQSSAPRQEVPAIPPPQMLPPVPGVDEQNALAPGRCPLCLQARVNPTACLTSGYLFCYLCIISYVQTSHKCPVTYAPTGIDDLVRVYDMD